MRNVLVTGATDGIGLQTALELHRLGWHVLVHGRSERKALKASDTIAADRGQTTPVWGDFNSLSEVAALADQIIASCASLDALVNNAGIYTEERKLSEQGIELTMAVNHVAPFLLTLRLLDRLRAAPAARIVNVSSMTHSSGKISLKDFNFERNWDAYSAYATSKLANVVFTRQLAADLAKTPVTANALHPGVIGTKLLRSGFGMGGGSVSDGARTSVYLTNSNEVAETSGEYFVDCRRAKLSADARDPRLARALWDHTAELVAQFL